MHAHNMYVCRQNLQMHMSVCPKGQNCCESRASVEQQDGSPMDVASGGLRILHASSCKA